MRDAFLYVEKLSKRYPAARGSEPLVVFEDVSFGIERGEFVCIVGHSGCGKSTILNVIAGLTRASEGYVFVDGKVIDQPGLSRGVIFQNHSLLPWKTALGNVVFSVKARWPEWTKEQVRKHSLDYLHMVGLRGAEQRRPAQLSGGMRQRVGIARAFAIQPQLLLMDEPFGALDALTRGTIQDELIRICARTQQTVFMITHDVDEAIYLSDRVLLMSNGPHAEVAKTVEINLPRPRDRTTLSRSPEYYELRTELVDFLVSSSAGTAGGQATLEASAGAGGASPASSQRPDTPAALESASEALKPASRTAS